MPEGLKLGQDYPSPSASQGSAVSFLNEVRGGDPAAQQISHILSALDGFVCYTIQ